MVTYNETGLNKALDPTRRSTDAQEFETALRRRVVGQDSRDQESHRNLPDVPGRTEPSPPASRKSPVPGTDRIRQDARRRGHGRGCCLATARACIKIDCAEFQHSHEIAKLIGSPPGYLGHRETHPLLTQEALSQWHTDNLKLSILLFDEIEKASDSFWQLLLGILDKATLTLGDNRKVDFSQCVIVMTSNLGAAEMSELINGGMGFAQKPAQLDARLDNKIDSTAVDAARRKFSPEFINRIDKIVVFRTLRAEHLEQILEIELGMVQQRILQTAGNNQFVFSCTPPVKQLLISEGTDMKYGARHLKRAIERHIVFPLADLVATRQIQLGDFVRIDRHGDGRMTFVKVAEGALVPVLLARYGLESSWHVAAARPAEHTRQPDIRITSIT